MKVKELIQLLEEFDGDLKVLFFSYSEVIPMEIEGVKERDGIVYIDEE